MKISSITMALLMVMTLSFSWMANASPDAQAQTYDSLTNKNWWKMDVGPNFSCLPDGAACKDNPGACCSGRCIYVNHGTDYCEYDGGGWGRRCLPSGTPCRHASRPCCTHCVVVKGDTDHCAY